MSKKIYAVCASWRNKDNSIGCSPLLVRANNKQQALNMGKLELLNEMGFVEDMRISALEVPYNWILERADYLRRK